VEPKAKDFFGVWPIEDIDRRGLTPLQRLFFRAENASFYFPKI
jgi:hypothetical protein